MNKTTHVIFLNLSEPNAWVSKKTKCKHIRPTYGLESTLTFSIQILQIKKIKTKNPTKKKECNSFNI